MQLTIIWMAFFLVILCQEVKAQLNKVLPGEGIAHDTTDRLEILTDVYEKPDWKTIDIHFLNSYYEQDGNNAAVTGGLGTERLTDFTQKIMLSVPTSAKMKLTLDAGYDYYSSASTDNIDNIRSSDSSSDMRVHANTGISYAINEQHNVGFRIGGSTEYDYTSLNGGLNYNWWSKDKNTSLGVAVQAFIDNWKIIYPTELRGEGRLVPTDKRQSYNAAVSFSRVINKKTQMSLQLEGTYMRGLLSTPFHRVYFTEQDRARVEQLPGTRLKIPIGLRVNNYLTDWLVVRWYYRYYWDDWGIQGHTASVELPIRINRFFSVYPVYRFYTQSAADYFLPYKEHSISDSFYSSDYDLSALNSHTVGLGISYAPAGGLAQAKLPFFKNTALVLSAIDLKLSHYRRSTGLEANIVSLGVKVEIR